MNQSPDVTSGHGSGPCTELRSGTVAIINISITKPPMSFPTPIGNLELDLQSSWR